MKKTDIFLKCLSFFSSMNKQDEENIGNIVQRDGFLYTKTYFIDGYMNL